MRLRLGVVRSVPGAADRAAWRVRDQQPRRQRAGAAAHTGGREGRTPLAGRGALANRRSSC